MFPTTSVPSWLPAACAGRSLLPFEAGTIIWRHELGGLIVPQAGQAYSDPLDVPLQLLPYGAVTQRVGRFRGHLTAYDACYAALAELVDAPLITLDRRVSAAPGTECRIEIPGYRG